MNIMIEKDGLEMGPFTVEEAVALLANGAFSENDQARPEGASTWATLKDVISQPKSSPLTSTNPIRFDTLPGSQSRPAPPGSMNTTRSLAPAGSQTKPGWLASKARTGSPASTGAPSTSGRPDFLKRSPQSASRKENDSGLNPKLVIGVVIATILVLGLVLLMAFAPGAVTKFLLPDNKVGLNVIQSLVTENNADLTVRVDGDVVVAEMTSVQSGGKLRDEVMKNIYSVAKERPSLNHLVLAVRTAANPPHNYATLKIDDLDAVRAFPDKDAYTASAARKTIDDALTAAGM